jgi:lipopolysaccharide-induced tumor necrosis factor-alpha factor
LFSFYLGDVTNKYASPFSGDRAGPYATVPQQEPIGEVKYPTYMPPTGTVTYGIQVVPVVSFNKNPVPCTCPNCRSMIVTRVEETTGLLAWVLCLLLCIFGCWLGCCLIPFCISDLQNVQHYCPNCNAFIGEYHPL